MNPKILVPKVRYGAIEIENLTGGEIDWDKIVPTTAETTSTEMLYKLPSHEIREEVDRCKKELASAPAIYTIINGVVKKDVPMEGKVLSLRERIRVGNIILNRRFYRRTKTIKSFEKGVYEIEPIHSPMNRGIFKDYIYEVKKGGKMTEKNEIEYEKVEREYWIPDYIDKDGQLVKGHFSVVEEVNAKKKCIVPYSREDSIKVKDFIILHRSGRLALKNPKNGKYIPSLGRIPHDEDERILQVVFRELKDSGKEFFVILPKGGRKSKKYGEFPMPWNEYHEKKNDYIPINQIIRKTYIPEIDGRNSKAKEVIGEYRGIPDGYVPVYTYDEEEHMRDFVPHLLSYNHMNFTDKMVIVLGTEEVINHIDNRINDANNLRNEFYNTTNQKIVGYKGKSFIKRCENLRVTVEDKESKYFGVNVKGTPEENLKTYLRNFDKTPSKRNDEEVKELIEIAQEADGRQTILNIEHDLRSQLRHLRTRSSKELYYLILGIEEEVDIMLHQAKFPGHISKLGKNYLKKLHKPGKKEQALLNVLQSFKSSKEIEETEGKGLTSDIEDLVTIEEKSNDSSYKKSKNLYSQTMGVLQRNQNPLNIIGIELLEDKVWRIRGGPISFPRNEELPKRNIRFVQRKAPSRRVELPGTMFPRSFTVSPRTVKVKTKEGIKSKMIGVRVERDPILCPSIQKEELPDWVLVKSPEYKGYPIGFGARNWVLVKSPEYKGYPNGFEKIYTQDWINKHMSVSAPNKEYVSNTVSGLKLPETKKYVLIRKTTYSLSEHLRRPVGMFDRVATCVRRVPLTERESILLRRGNKKGNIVRTSHNKPSSFKVLHTVGDGEGNIDYYIISINGMKLYAKGDLSLLNNPAGSLSFTGTRTPKEITKKFVKGVVNMFLEDDDYVTISGGAEGCDTIVHSSTLRKGGKTIMVMAGGFNGQFVKKNQIKPETILKRDGLLLSEHPPEYSPKKKDFVLRNKVIASLSERLVVFEAGNGTKHCAEFGVELGKELLVQTISNKKIKLVSRRDYPF